MGSIWSKADEMLDAVKGGLQNITANSPIDIKDIGSGLKNVISPQRIIKGKEDEIINAANNVVERMTPYMDETEDAVKKVTQAQKDIEYTKSAANGNSAGDHSKGFLAGTRDSEGKMVGGFFQNTKDYALAKDFEGSKRLAVGAARVGGGLFVAGTAGRLVTGTGGPMTDRYGERDIAGIPFL